MEWVNSQAWLSFLEKRRQEMVRRLCRYAFRRLLIRLSYPGLLNRPARMLKLRVGDLPTYVPLFHLIRIVLLAKRFTGLSPQQRVARLNMWPSESLLSETDLWGNRIS